MALIDGLRNSGLLAFDCNFNNGSLTDSVSGNVGTITAPVNWSRSGKQRGLYFNNTGVITYPSTTANKLIGGQSTVIVFGGPFNWYDGCRIITKRSSGTSWDFFYQNTAQGIGLYDGTNTSTLSVTISNSKFLAFTNIAGTTPAFYKDGNLLGVGSTVITPKNTNDLLYIGNGWAGVNLTVRSTISRVLGISRALTPSEISTIYEELLTPSATIKQYSFPGKLAQVPDTFYGSELLVDGDMEAAGVANWVAGGTVVLSKTTSSPYSGLQSLRLTGNSGSIAYQNIAAGKKYNFSGWQRSVDGVAVPAAFEAGTILSLGTTSTSWQYFNVTFIATGSSVGGALRTSNGVVEFDNLSVRQVYGKKNLKLHYLLDKPIPGTQTIADLSGNGYNGTATGIGSGPGLVAKESVRFHGNDISYVNLTSGLTNTIGGNNTHAISLWMNLKGSGGVTISSSSAAQMFFQIVANAYRWGYGGTYRTYANTTANYTNVWVHVVMQKTGAGDSGNLYINGVLQSSYTGTFGSIPASPGDLLIGKYAVAGSSFNGNVQDFRIYDQNLTKQEIDDLYFEGARKLNFYAPMKNETEVTLVATTLINSKVSNTPFSVQSSGGSFAIEHVRNKKMITASVANKTIGFESNQAFGTWIFEHICAPTEVANGPIIEFICSQKQGYTSSGNNSYGLQITAAGAYYFYKATNGVFGGILAQQVLTNANRSISVAITRNNSGVFNLYIKNPTWILSSATFTDLSFTTSNYFNITPLNGTNIQISNIRLHDGVLTLDQIKSLYPSG